MTIKSALHLTKVDKLLYSIQTLKNIQWKDLKLFKKKLNVNLHEMKKERLLRKCDKKWKFQNVSYSCSWNPTFKKENGEQ